MCNLDSEQKGSFLLELYRKAVTLPDQELYEYFLDHAVNVTKSTIGFFHFVSEDQESIILTSWNKEALKNCSASYANHYPIEQAGNWADCVRLKRPIIYNDFGKSPNQKGLPEGHVPIKRILSVPIMENGKTQAIFGVGNKADPYDEEDVVQLDLVANELNKILKQRRIERELREAKEKYSSLFANMLDGFAYCEMIFDEEAKPVDFVYLEINDAFERLTGLRRENVVGRKVSEAIPGTREANPEIFSIYGRVAQTGIPERFELFFKPLNMWLYISVYSPRRGYFAAVFENVTERRKAEEALVKSETKFRTAANFTYDWEYWIAPDGNFVYVSPSCERITGYKPEEFIEDPKLLAKIIHPEDKAVVSSHFDLVNSSELYDVEFRIFRIITRAGETRWISHACQAVFDDHGEWLGRRASNRDITERKQNEEKLGKLNRTLRAISNSNQALLRATDEASFLKEACRIITEDCGYKMVWVGIAEDDEAKSIRPVAYHGFEKGYIDTLKITWADTERGRGPTGRAVRTGQPQFCQDMQTDPSFIPWREEALKRGYASSIALPLKSDSKVFGALTMYSAEPSSCSADEVKLLTELANDFAHGIMMLRLRSEQERAQAEIGKQAALINLSPDGIVVRDLEGKITFWSKGAERLYGWKRKEVLGHLAHKILKTKFPEPYEIMIAKIKETGKWSGELVHTTKKGTQIIVQSWWQPKLDQHGNVVELMESNVDITERKQMESKLEEYSKNLERLVEERTKQLKDSERLAAIGATAGMVGHDIRNPLQAMMGDVYLARSDLASMSEGEGKQGMEENLDSIEKNVDYINKIVQDLQDYARPLKPVFQETNLEELCDEVLFKNGVPEGIDVSCRIEKEPKNIVTDPTLLKRVISNLVNNAVQSMPEGGKLAIHAYPQVGGTVITVEDTGCGIPKEIRSKIFMPLFTTKSKGQGFGLPVIKRMTEALGGTVTFESEVGKGTKFLIRLPTQRVER